MSFDFPNAPTNGQTVTAPTGVVYGWDGTKWAPVAVALPPYAPLASPTFTGDPQAPTPASGDHDTSLATTAFVQAAVAPAMDNVGRNLLHNPLFNVAQRGAGPFTGVAILSLDRWMVIVGTDAASFTQTGMTDANRVQIGDEAAEFNLANVFTGNAAAGAYTRVQQGIEDVRRLAGKTVTVSFWALATSALKLGINIQQYFGSGGSPSAPVNALATGASVTLGTAWTRYSTTIAIPSASGMTPGTNNDHKTNLQFWYSSGATNAAIAGNIGVQSGTIWLWGVQLEVGSVATPLEKPDPQQDLAKCQRFYQTMGVYSQGYFSGATGIAVSTTLLVGMRALPTLALYTNGSTNVSGIGFGNIGGNAAFVQATAGGSGHTLFVTFTASADL